MIYTLALTIDMKLMENISLNEINSKNIKWYWVDFDCPTHEESELLSTFFNFHPLAIEDCLHYLQRPKVDKYENYNFFVIHALNNATLTSTEVDMFAGNNFIVSFHKDSLEEFEHIKNVITKSPHLLKEGIIYIEYEIFDELVDNYFPPVYEIEDRITDLEEIEVSRDGKYFIDKIFSTRNDLLKLRRIINQMRDLLYRIITSEHLSQHKNRHAYFADIYDHLLRLSEIIESSLLMTSDLRDSYMSMTSDKMNKIMMFFTAITTIFVPVTFIAGVYGMNFSFMPELTYRYGYFIVLFIMLAIIVSMFILFKKKGWFNM
ncbi:magnesium/cobalt transporter CorA [Clostridium oryzae]|uniref:Magnesium transport protein CorA n=1 Tax=Clostridium oryzae TaxID=1450648 RepID=A0A1V4IY83_9CLOT|nr:magnesium/cobalt transporter CorA [Clostridium oryzae]OPJ65028.1 magnesium transport protein CorA [Clostridium oryzae]